MIRYDIYHLLEATMFIIMSKKADIYARAVLTSK
jgi:hypothetical protein